MFSYISYFPSSFESLLITSLITFNLYLLTPKSFAIFATAGTGTASGLHPTQSSLDTKRSSSSYSVTTFASVVCEMTVPSGFVTVVVAVPSGFVVTVVVVPSLFAVLLVVVPSSFVVVVVVFSLLFVPAFACAPPLS